MELSRAVAFVFVVCAVVIAAAATAAAGTERFDRLLADVRPQRKGFPEPPIRFSHMDQRDVAKREQCSPRVDVRIIFALIVPPRSSVSALPRFQALRSIRSRRESLVHGRSASPIVARGTQKLCSPSLPSVYTLIAESPSSAATNFASARARGTTSCSDSN